GIGAGTKDFLKHPNILRVVVGESSPQRQQQQQAGSQLCVMEANIDDMTGEVAGHLTQRLLGGGSLDAWVSPIYMKKGRPAYTVHALSEQQDEERVLRVLFKESTTIGVRKRLVDRCSLRRQTLSVATKLGPVRVKVAWLDGIPTNAKPEYEDCKVRSAGN
ncbi:unnamed protein product, partial [Discosporangium mesarthrocarpum]